MKKIGVDKKDKALLDGFQAYFEVGKVYKAEKYVSLYGSIPQGFDNYHRPFCAKLKYPLITKNSQIIHYLN